MKRAIHRILSISLVWAGTHAPIVAAPDASTPPRPQVPAEDNPQAGTMRGDEAARRPEVQSPAEWNSPSSADLGSRVRLLEAEEIDGNEEGGVAYSPATGGEDFESGFPDGYWSVGDLNGGNGFDYWDDVTCNPLSGSYSAWCAGVGSQADCSLYDDHMDAFMCVEAQYTGSSQNGTDHFYFSLWNEVEACCDYAWISIAAFKHEPRHGIGVCDAPLVGRLTLHSTSACHAGCECHDGRCWRDFRVALGPDFNHFDFLRICFRFHSDESVHHEGAYFDDISFNGPADSAIFPILGGFDGDSCLGDAECTTNSHCDFGEFCKRDDGECTGGGECFPKPTSCSGTIDRVCGCNGQTYDNRCRAHQAGVNVGHAGSCIDDSGCTSNSHCDFGKFCKRDDGDCTGEGDCFLKPVSCSTTINRVCGCNGQTYDNRCRANQAGVNVGHLGPCVTCTGGPFTIGGVVYSDCSNPLTTGIEDVTVDVTCGSSTFMATTGGSQGLWQIPNVPCGTCTVCPHKPGNTFHHVGPACQPGDPCHTITVNQANQGANQSIQFLGMGSCERFDLNDDGFPSIIGDVPLAVDCIYHDDCNCPHSECLCPGDCNCDGFLSIVGDVPCLVDCYYHGDCEDQCAGVAQAIATSAGFTVGGAIFTDVRDPIATGLADVVVELIAVSDPNARFQTTSSEDFGLWRIDGVPEGAYRVIYDAGRGSDMAVKDGLVIEVSAENEAANQSLAIHSRSERVPKNGEADRRVFPRDRR